jgi:lipoate---protein ligase
MRAMRCLNLTYPTPEENLACDEALLEACENGLEGEMLRFWEPDRYFLVLGYSNKALSETYHESCRQEGVPILRRPSGGGTVLQGPGCLNFSLVLKIPQQGPLKSLTGTNAFVMNAHKEALQPLLKMPVAVQGITDLTAGGLKFSGNAQRRRRSALLFHGTFLWNFDIAKVEKFLQMPERQPEYRQNRPHGRFIANVPLSPAQIREALCKKWKTDNLMSSMPVDGMHELTKKYHDPSWNFKF